MKIKGEDKDGDGDGDGATRVAFYPVQGAGKRESDQHLYHCWVSFLFLFFQFFLSRGVVAA